MSNNAHQNDQAHDREQHHFQYTSGRWLYNEPEQLKNRYLEFDSDRLKEIAASSQHSCCIEFQKLPEGLHNKVFLIGLENGAKLIARLPNPSAGHPHHVVASEVATLDFLRDVVGIPVPKVFDWSRTNSCANQNGVGAEYMLMEHAPGRQLSTVWSSMSSAQRLELAKGVIEVEKKLTSTMLPAYGSIYFRHDSPACESPNQHVTNIINESTDTTNFVIGPVADASFWSDKTQDRNMDRGPWESTQEYYAAVARREIARIKSFESTKARKTASEISATSLDANHELHIGLLHKFIAVLPYILPSEKVISRATLWHRDLHENNIFVDNHDPTKITSIIDWQNVWAAPLFTHARVPSIFDCPWPYPKGAIMPTLPDNFPELSPQDQFAEEGRLLDIKLKKFYEIGCRRLNPLAWRAMATADSDDDPVAGILQLVHQTSTDGPCPLRELLIQIYETWDNITIAESGKHIPCPIYFSPEEIQLARTQAQIWGEAFAAYEELRTRLLGKDGWVSHEEYAKARDEYCAHKDELERLKGLLDRVSVCG